MTLVCKFGVLQTLLYMVQAVEHGPGDERPSDNDVGRLKPKRTQLETTGCWCRQALKVGQKEQSLLWENNQM